MSNGDNYLDIYFGILHWKNLPKEKIVIVELGESQPNIGRSLKSSVVFRYSNHLNTEHLKFEHLIFEHFFDWFSNGLITWLGRSFENRTFLNIKQKKFVRFSDHHSKTRLFDNWTHFDHLNTRLIQFSYGYCTEVSYLSIVRWSTCWWRAAAPWRSWGRTRAESSSCWSSQRSREFCCPKTESPEIEVVISGMKNIF